MQELLKQIQDPTDLRKLPMEQLPQLAAEIREIIIRTVAKNGGHLASNLGAVELSLALHYAFQTPTDKLIWDVGHQCYTHKLICGRREEFHSLRQPGGISGFCNREESPYDCFTTGHSSNSISLAFGMAQARDKSGGQEKVVAVIGDGALTGGMAFEGLNHAGDLPTNFVVVLNDNGMSIGGNVGAMSRRLSALRSGRKYNRAKHSVSRLLLKLPLLGPALVDFISGFKHTIKSAVVPGMLFENFGFVYLGPIDGHDIPAMVEIFQRAAELKRPALVHVKTIKGKGMSPAEKQPELFHGMGRFDVETGASIPSDSKPSYTDIFSKTMMELAKEREDIIAVTAAMCQGTGLSPFSAAYPERFFDVGIAEQHAISFCAGLANGGQRPVAAIYSSFLQRAYDQLVEDVCLQNLPLILAVDRASLVGDDGCSHQGIFDLSYLRSIPNMTIMAPADGPELRMMLRAALDFNSPTAIRYPRCTAAVLNQSPVPIEKGKGILLREGGDFCLFAIGTMVEASLEAAELLAIRGIQAAVVNARFAAPLDQELLLKLLSRCKGRILTAEENTIKGGFGAACAESLAASGMEYDLCIAALPEQFIPQGKRNQQLAEFGLDGPGLAERAMKRWFPERMGKNGTK
ncbi:MAG: 1-deoxy-D-xylulose-5-phosphate synthase [Bacillota bacterium]|nr:1-deoxy-D-xylulose-5-phosphate synthase [Bacillota bacterium]